MSARRGRAARRSPGESRQRPCVETPRAAPAPRRCDPEAAVGRGSRRPHRRRSARPRAAGDRPRTSLRAGDGRAPRSPPRGTPRACGGCRSRTQDRRRRGPWRGRPSPAGEPPWPLRPESSPRAPRRPSSLQSPVAPSEHVAQINLAHLWAGRVGMRRVRRPLPSATAETRVIVEEPAAPPPGPPMPGAPLEEPPPNRELWPWLLVLLALVIAGIVVAVLLSRDDKK